MIRQSTQQGSEGRRGVRQIHRILVAMIILAIFVPAFNVFGDTITQFSNRSSFTASVGGTLTTEDFTDSFHFPITTGILNSSTNLPGIGILPGTIQSGVTYSTPVGDGNFFNIDAGGGYTGGFLDGFNPSNRKVTVAFDNDVRGFGFDLGSLGSQTFDVTIQFASGPDQTFTNLYPSSLQFFGFQSASSDIKSVTIGNNGGFFAFDFDNFTFGGAATRSVPEPGTYVLMLVGLGMLGIVARRRKLASAAI
jgi:hypothetical protein